MKSIRDYKSLPTDHAGIIWGTAFDPTPTMAGSQR